MLDGCHSERRTPFALDIPLHAVRVRKRIGLRSAPGTLLCTTSMHFTDGSISAPALCVMLEGRILCGPLMHPFYGTRHPLASLTTPRRSPSHRPRAQDMSQIQALDGDGTPRCCSPRHATYKDAPRAPLPAASYNKTTTATSTTTVRSSLPSTPLVSACVCGRLIVIPGFSLH
jgi:hypothetical protein